MLRQKGLLPAIKGKRGIIMTAVKNGKIELLTPEKNERNMGVELFRIVSMMLVILLHVLGHGGVLSYSKHLSANYKAAWFLETIG